MTNTETEPIKIPVANDSTPQVEAAIPIHTESSVVQETTNDTKSTVEKAADPEIVIKDKVQKEALFDALSRYLRDETRTEARGYNPDYAKDEITHNESLRAILRQLIPEFDKSGTYAPKYWLFRGIPDFLSESELEKIANSDYNGDDTVIIARHLLDKKAS